MFREYRATEIRLFFRFDLPNNTHDDTSIRLIDAEHAKAIKALFDNWNLIEQDDRHQVYERNAPR